MDIKTTIPLPFNATSIPPLNDNQQAQTSIYHIVMPIFAIVCIIVNISVVFSSGLILKKNQQPKTTYLFLGNVSLTDTISSIAILIGIFVPKASRTHDVCAFQIGLIVASILASVFSVTLIAIDRFLFSVYGMFYSKWMYPHRARTCIAAVWILASIIGFLPLMGWSRSTDNGRVCWFIIIAPKELMLLTVLIGAFCLVIVIILNALILRKALKAINHIQRADENTFSISESSDALRRTRTTNVQVSQPTKWRAVKVVSLTFGSFVITWGPYFIASLLYAYSTDEKLCGRLKSLIASPLAVLGFLNSVLNPMIYAWWHKGFRKFVRQRCCKKVGIGARLQETSTSRRDERSSSTKKESTTS